jgi:HEPN domain-containing protein
MKDETRAWLSYADENLGVSALTLEHGHLNACLQNAQQAVEKYLKAVIIERNLPFLRTHSVRELTKILADQKITPPICEDEMDLMDAIYVPSKYPVYSALPQAIPDQALCHEALNIARRVRDFVHGILKSGKVG